MGIFEAILLGIIQGLTEFLPISSSAHLRIASELMGIGDAGAAFTGTAFGSAVTPSGWRSRRVSTVPWPGAPPCARVGPVR